MLHVLTPSARTIGRWIQGTSAAAVVALSLNAGALTGQAPQFTPISVGDFIQAAHIIELRTAIDALRAQRGLAPYTWVRGALAGAVVRAGDVAELRAAVSEMFAADGKVPPAFTDFPLTPGVTVIRARHLTELQSAVLALASSSLPEVSLASPGNGMVGDVAAYQLEDRERTAPADFQWRFNVSPAAIGELTAAGYRIIDIGIASASPLRLNAVLVRNTGEYAKGWWWYYGATAADVSTLLQQNNARLIDVEPYDDGTGAKHAVVMISNSGRDAALWSWQFHVSAAAIQDHLSNNPQDRIIDFGEYAFAGGRYFKAIYIRNTGDHARAWWWYTHVAGGDINQLVLQNSATVVQLQHSENGLFNVLMQRVPGGPRWWAYSGVTSQFIDEHLRQNAARLTSVHRWSTLNGDRFAATMVGAGGSPPPPPPSSGQIMFWIGSDLGGPITVIGGGTSVGTLTQHFPNGAPSCGAAGTVTVSAPVGSEFSYSARCVEGDPFTGQYLLQWFGIVNPVNAGCTPIQLTYTGPARCPSGTTGGGGGGGGGTGGERGTVVSRCVTNVQRLPASQQGWNAMPAPFAGLDFKVYFRSLTSVYEVIFRNRYTSTIHYNFGPAAGSPPTVTGYRSHLSSGRAEDPSFEGIRVPGLGDGGTACVLVDQVRFGLDSGPYQ